MRYLLIGILVFTGCATTNSRIAQRSLNQVVAVEVTNLIPIPNSNEEYKELKASGAGVFISPNGHILTAAHMFRDNVSFVYVQTYKNPHAFYGATILYKDKVRDLALLKIDYPSRNYARIAPIHSIKVGEPVIAIGHPMGLDWTVTHGIISRFTDDGLLIQNDAAINRGNSGGPLYDYHGKLIGINVHIYTPSMTATSAGLSMATSPLSIYRFLSNFRGLD